MDVKPGLELRNEAAALFVGLHKIRDGMVQRDLASDAIEYYMRDNVSPNDMKKLKASREYKAVKKFGPDWKKHLDAADKVKKDEE